MRFLSLTLAMLTAGCLGTGAPKPGDLIDSLGHFAAGYAIARDMVKNWDDDHPVDRDRIVQIVMDYAEAREDTQHFGRCGSGCQQDLREFRRGAESGSGVIGHGR